jgi:hypothetical protein
MRIVTGFMRSAPLAAALLIGGLAAPAFADDLYGEQVHADSFGNLVIYSPSGYKRIVVGKGHLAPALARITGNDGPTVIYGDAEESYGRSCRREPMRWQGRSRMYGLPDHVVPTPGWRCRD